MAGRRVLFTHSYFLRYDPKQWDTMQPYAPLGTIYAASYLRNKEYEVQLHDVMFEHGPESIQHVLENFRPDTLVIYDDGFNYLTKMCLTNMREAAFTMSKLAKAMGCNVIISSSDSTDHYAKYLDNDADYIIIGEGEQTLYELCEALRSKEVPAPSLPGIAYKLHDKIIHTGKRTVLTDLDTLPLPAWDLVSMKQYQAAWRNKHGYFSINIGTTRGCPYKCNWCAKPIYGNRYNARSPENVVEELLLLKDSYGFDHVWFCDDIFGLKPGWVKQFAMLVNKHGLKFSFKIQSRADLLLNDEQITYLAATGCNNVWMGAESGSQKILDAMDKGTTVQQIEEATRLLKKHNIRPAYFLQFGYPGETIEDIKMTLELLKRNIPGDIGISVSYPLPGTKFFESVKEQLVNKTNWSDSDELALMFKNTYSPEFYKQLHRYVHAYYRYIRTGNFIKNNTIDSRINTLLMKIKMPYYKWLAVKERRILNKIQPLNL